MVLELLYHDQYMQAPKPVDNYSEIGLITRLQQWASCFSKIPHYQLDYRILHDVRDCFA